MDLLEIAQRETKQLKLQEAKPLEKGGNDLEGVYSRGVIQAG